MQIWLGSSEEKQGIIDTLVTHVRCPYPRTRPSRSRSTEHQDIQIPVNNYSKLKSQPNGTLQSTSYASRYILVSQRQIHHAPSTTKLQDLHDSAESNCVSTTASTQGKSTAQGIKKVLTKVQIQNHQLQAPKANSQIYTSPGEEKLFASPLGARESNSSKTTVTHHMSPHLKNPRFGTGAKNARKHHKSTTFGKEKGTSFGSPHTVKVPNTPPQNDLSSSENI